MKHLMINDSSDLLCPLHTFIKHSNILCQDFDTKILGFFSKYNNFYFVVNIFNKKHNIILFIETQLNDNLLSNSLKINSYFCINKYLKFNDISLSNDRLYFLFNKNCHSYIYYISLSNSLKIIGGTLYKLHINKHLDEYYFGINFINNKIYVFKQCHQSLIHYDIFSI
jgi:hypothetical protein